MTGTLSWSDLENRYWLGPACWYGSIIFALSAIVFGAQQTLVLEQLAAQNTERLHRSLCRQSTTAGKLRGHPRWAVVFAWQCPLMFLSYSIVLFLAGLTSHVASPVARNRKWDHDAQVSDEGCLMFETFKS